MKRKHILIFLICLLGLIHVESKASPISALHSDSVDTSSIPIISLLTCSPSDEEPYMMYGHTALRVKEGKNDLIFNYGLFSFQQENFLWNFMMGKPMYILGITTFDNFIYEYKEAHRGITEQVLNLSQQEAENLYNALLINAQPQNRSYQYNIFYNNCATKPLDLINKYCGGLKGFDTSLNKTFRHTLYQYTERDHWYTFGCDLCLGAPTDKLMTKKEACFLPPILEENLPQFTRLDNGESIVSSTNILLPNDSSSKRTFTAITPTVCISVIGAIYILILLLVHFKKIPQLILKSYQSIIYTMLGSGGLIIWFLGFISEHPHTFPNLNMIPLNPFYLIILILLWMKSCKKPLIWLYFIIFVGMIFYAVAFNFQLKPEGMQVLSLLLIGDAIMSISRIRQNR